MNELLNTCQKLVKISDDYLSQNPSKDFHLFAQSLLEDAKVYKLFKLEELLEIARSKKFEAIQNYKYFEFSDLPFTLTRGESCFIEIYCWYRRPTTIHNHHFQGAFQCLHGMNYNLEFDFISSQKFGDYHEIGELRHLHSRQIAPGQVEAIGFLDDFIHQSLHLEELTINLCLRTNDQVSTHLSNFLLSGFKYQRNPHHLRHMERLSKMIIMMDLDINKQSFDLDDAFSFIIYNQYVQHPKIQAQKDMFFKLIQNETKINFLDYLLQHDEESEKWQKQYE